MSKPKKRYSTPFAIMMGLFFACWGTAGAAGLIWWLLRDRSDQLELDRQAAPAMAILFTCLCLVGLCGIVHVARGERRFFQGEDEFESRLQANTPLANLIGGLLVLFAGVAATAFSYLLAAEEELFTLFYGAIVFGSLQAIFGFAQAVTGRRDIKL